MVLVTGATGHFGSAAIDVLLSKLPADTIAALVRDEQKAVGLRSKGVDVRAGDYTDPESMERAFAGVEKLLLVSSNTMDRLPQHINAIDAAKKAGVKHIVYTGFSLKDAKNTAIPPIVDSHAGTYEYLRNSGLNYSLLHNTLYADVLPMFMGEHVVDTGIFFPSGNGRVPYATRADMAEAAAYILLSAGSENKEYSIVGDISYTFADIAAMLSEITGISVTYLDPTAEAYRTQLLAAGVPEEIVGFSGAFAEAIRRNEFDQPGSGLADILGRRPTHLKDYLRSVYGAAH